MKKITLIVIVLLCGKLFAQTKIVPINERKIGDVSCSYSKLIYIDRLDTVHYLSFKFQNAEYSTIIDTKSINFFKNEDLNEFLKDFKNSIAELDQKSSVRWTKKYYSISVGSNSSKILLSKPTTEGGGFTVIKQKDAEKMIAWAESIVIGYEF